MPDTETRKSFRFRYDRERFKAKAKKLTYNEARRLNGPIYDVLIAELFEEGCMTTAKYFQCLVEKEKRLLQSESISKTVSQKTDLLYALFEYFKLAEISSRLLKNKCTAATVKCFYQGLLIAENAGSKFQWLTEELYAIVVKVIHQFKMDELINNEIKMRIYYRHGNLLAKNNSQLISAIKYLEMALAIAIGQNWIPDAYSDMYQFQTMHEATAVKLSYVLLQHANAVFSANEQQAIDLANKAIVTLKTTDLERNKLQISEAYLTKIKFILDMKSSKRALKEIKKIQGPILAELSYDFQHIKCKLYLYKGRAYYDLEFNEEAMFCLQKAFAISRSEYMRPLEAEIQLHMAKVHAMNTDELDYAHAAYEAAKLLFIDVKDFKNLKKVNYLKAKCKVTQIFPKLIALIKSDNYCKRMDLLRWKNRCVPFWCSEKIELLEKQWSLVIRDELKKENKITERIMKSNKSMASRIVFKDIINVASEEELNKSGGNEKNLKKHKNIELENITTVSAKTSEVIEEYSDELKEEEDKDQAREIEEVKNMKAIKKEQSVDDFVDSYKTRLRVIPSYIEKINRKRRMPDYKKWLELSFHENKIQAPLHCLLNEYSNSC